MPSLKDNHVENIFDEIDEFELYRIETENRIKNLMWTVSGDYSLKVCPDVESFRVSKYISLYDAIKQGAISKYYDRDELSLYIVKKVFLSGDEDFLIYISQICLDVAIQSRLFNERAGVKTVKQKAYDDILEHYFDKMNASLFGRVKIALIRETLGINMESSKQVAEILGEIHGLDNNASMMDVIRVVDHLYNTYIDRQFEKKHGDLDSVLAVSMEELSEYSWKDFLKDQEYEDLLEQYLEEVADSLTDMTKTRNEKNEEQETRKKALLKVIDKDKVEKIFSYVEMNYGKSYLSRLELERLDRKLCTGPHANCSLYYTDGILHNPVAQNYRYLTSKHLVNNNIWAYHKNHRVVKKNISDLSSVLKRSINFRNQKEYITADNGTIIPGRLWKIGRVNDNRLFDKELIKDNSEFVVEILMDASGSQSKRQESVAIQGYIISEALTNAGIPHRVMGYSAFWNYTVLQRYRDYDEGIEGDKKVLEYVASSNNRDGLAIRAAVDGLIARNEDNKILIVLSDGMPNDNTVARDGVKTPRPYVGRQGVKDTASEIRCARNMGISVLGVFTGLESELKAEQLIFGKDFAYIRDINNFANIVSVYLKKQILDV